MPQTIDARTGAAVSAPPPPVRSATKEVTPNPPVPGARLLSSTPAADAAIYLHHGPDGSRLWLAGGAGRPISSTTEIWRGNDAIKTIALGRPESIAYTSADGQPLTAWLLLPPAHKDGAKAPLVTIVYPTTVYGPALPPSLSAYSASVHHPQLFAALGYAVLLPSMPATKDPRDSHAIDKLLGSVLPAVDAAIARGAIDEHRVAVAGHSDGGFAALAMVAQTNRFRSAIASASFSNLVSFYGVVRGDSTHGDVFRPEMGQVMRMLQFEKGLMGLNGPPWTNRDVYLRNSAVLLAHEVQTPVMLIHGELDNIPSQQAEEFFAALLRQDKRAQLVRYAGEGHAIADRENVIDVWQRIATWLAETMPPRH
jgi:dipeptidyl aminopeptidase/acylaminoacyl peptidase